MKKKAKRKEKVKKKEARMKEKDKEVKLGDVWEKTVVNGVGSIWMTQMGKMSFRRTLVAHHETNSFRKHLEPSEL